MRTSTNVPRNDVIIGLLLFLPNCLLQEITRFIVGETYSDSTTTTPAKSWLAPHSTHNRAFLFFVSVTRIPLAWMALNRSFLQTYVSIWAVSFFSVSNYCFTRNNGINPTFSRHLIGTTSTAAALSIYLLHRLLILHSCLLAHCLARQQHPSLLPMSLTIQFFHSPVNGINGNIM